MIYITGAFDDVTEGRTQAALQYLMALKTAGYTNFQLSQIGGGVAWRLLPRWTEPLAYARQTTDDHTNVGIVHALPELLTRRVLLRGRARNYGLAMFDTDRVSPCLIAQYTEHLAGLIVPTPWQKQVLTSSGYTGPVEVLPPPVGSDFWLEVDKVKAQAQQANGPYTFYYVGTWNNRKNPVAVLRAYLRAFPVASSDVRLVLKISQRGAYEDFRDSVMQTVAGSAARLEQDIQIIDDLFTDEQMVWLHASCDCYVSAHRAEGWGTGIFQAAISGNRVIATGWSAPVFYLQSATDILVPYYNAPVGASGPVATLGHASESDVTPPYWAHIDEYALVEALQRAAREREGRSANATNTLRGSYSREAVGVAFKAFLERVENEARQAP